ncbi:ETC complex I subunit [bacterium NHP-B]|nr:ETC complex I subunit [bacterium NHP-B]
MHDVIIFRPTKSPTQSGRMHREIWHLVFQASSKMMIDPAMHWHSQRDTCQEVILKFKTKQKAVDYAKQKKWRYIVQKDPPVAPMHKHSYTEHLLKPHLRS